MTSQSDDTISLEALLTSSPDENKNTNTHSSYAVSTSKSSSSSSHNYSTSTSSAKSASESMQASSKPNTLFTTNDKRMLLLKKKSHSYQDLHLPSVRRRYANVQSKVKGYIDSLQPPRHVGANTTPMLRQKSMPDTFQNLLKEEAMSPGAVQRKLNSVQADIADMSKMISFLQHDLETVRIEKHLLAKKVENMQTEKYESPKVSTVASQKIPIKVVTSTGTQTCDFDEANRNYELSTTVSLHSLADDSALITYRALTDYAEVNERELGQKEKKKSSLKNKVKRMFICIG